MPSPLRVTRVIGVLEPGGAQLSMLRLAQAQREFGVETTLLAGDATPQGVALARRFGLEPVVYEHHESLSRSPRQWCPDPEFAAWLRPWLADCHLAHAHMFGAWWAVSTAAPTGLPVVASEHNALHWPLGDHTAAAAAAKDRVAVFFAHGPDATDFAIRIGVPPERLRPGRSAIAVCAEACAGLPYPRLTYTGRLREDKGPDLLIRALAAMETPPPTYLVGDGPMRPVLERMVADLGLQRLVRFTGWDYEPSRYVAGSAVHVLPSRHDAWPQSALVALALGVPVVGTAVGGLPGMLGDGRGALAPAEDPQGLADTITAVLRGDVPLDRAAGQRLAADHDPAQIAAEYLQAYEVALAQPVRQS